MRYFINCKDSACAVLVEFSREKYMYFGLIFSGGFRDLVFLQEQCWIPDFPSQCYISERWFTTSTAHVLVIKKFKKEGETK